MLEDDFVASVDEDEKPTPKLIIFDDVAYSGNLKNKTAGIVSKIVMNGRHAMISSIFTSQKYSLISTGVRTNLTGAIFFGTNKKEMELIEADFNFLPTKAEFFEMFMEATKKRNSFLVVNMNKTLEEGRYMNSDFEPILPASICKCPAKKAHDSCSMEMNEKPLQGQAKQGEAKKA
jgi:hypothetical protein